MNFIPELSQLLRFAYLAEFFVLFIFPSTFFVVLFSRYYVHFPCCFLLFCFLFELRASPFTASFLCVDCFISTQSHLYSSTTGRRPSYSCCFDDIICPFRSCMLYVQPKTILVGFLMLKFPIPSDNLTFGMILSWAVCALTTFLILLFVSATYVNTGRIY